MSERFRKEAGFRYRVDGNVGLHYMNGNREEYREEDESALFEDFGTLDAALSEAKAYVNCEGGWDRYGYCDGKPFEISKTRHQAIGSFEERVAEVIRLGLAADPNDPEDEGEWEPCDEDGVFDFEDGCGDTAVEYLCGAPGQVREAWDRAVHAYWDYLDYKRGDYPDVLDELGFQGEGWYALDPYREDGSRVDAERARGAWLEDRGTFNEAFTKESARARGGEVVVGWLGDGAFPDEDVDVDWGRGEEDMDVLWNKIRGAVREMGAGQAAAFIGDVSLAVDVFKPSGALEILAYSESPYEMLAIMKRAAMMICPTDGSEARRLYQAAKAAVKKGAENARLIEKPEYAERRYREMIKKVVAELKEEATKPALRSNVYRTVEPGWSERGCWEDLPVEKLEVSLEWTGDDGERTSDSESMTVPDDWDFTDGTDYDRLAKALCERNGIEYSEFMWRD